MVLSRSFTDHHLRCGGWLNFEFSSYPHDGRADKDSYPHDCRADNAPYRHDRRADRNMRFSSQLIYALFSILMVSFR